MGVVIVRISSSSNRRIQKYMVGFFLINSHDRHENPSNVTPSS